MENLIKEFKNKTKTLLADGATGTNYFSSGLQPGDPPELWNLKKSNDVLSLHKEFILAGANIILTNSFGANSSRLKFHNIENQVKEINFVSARLAKKAISSTPKLGNVLVAGSIGPTGEIFKSNGGFFTYEDALEVFYNQAISLKEGGVDFLWIETLSSLEEVDAALSAADKANIFSVITMSFDTAKKTMMGVSPKEFIKFIYKRKVKPLAIGANCGVGPSELLSSINEMKTYLNDETLLVAKGNCGIPQYKSGEISYSGNNQIMARYALLCKLLGIDIVGGCCGTTPEHIKYMSDSLNESSEFLKKNKFEEIFSKYKNSFDKLIASEIGQPWQGISSKRTKLKINKRKRRRLINKK